MSTQAIIFLLLLSTIFALVILSVVLFVIFYKTNKKINIFLEKGKIKDFKDIVLGQKEKNESIDGQIKEIFSKIKNLEAISEITIRKRSVIRFNPFGDMGGDQSFIVALLDNNNNGFLISSLFFNDGNRVYAKEVKNGKSDKTLSKEENEALEKAINGK